MNQQSLKADFNTWTLTVIAGLKGDEDGGKDVTW